MSGEALWGLVRVTLGAGELSLAFHNKLFGLCFIHRSRRGLCDADPTGPKPRRPFGLTCTMDTFSRLLQWHLWYMSYPKWYRLTVPIITFPVEASTSVSTATGSLEFGLYPLLLGPPQPHSIFFCAFSKKAPRSRPTSLPAEFMFL